MTAEQDRMATWMAMKAAEPEPEPGDPGMRGEIGFASRTSESPTEDRTLSSTAYDHAESNTDAEPDSHEFNHAWVTWAVLLAFNPPDDDMGFDSLICDAIERAERFIEKQPCTCPPDPEEDGACERCEVLGRRGNEEIGR